MHLTDETLAGMKAGRLDPAAAGAVRDHLDACPSCAGRMRSLVRWQALLGDVQEIDAPEEVASPRVLERMSARAPRIRRGWQAWRAAAALLLIAGAAVLWSTRQTLPVAPGGQAGGSIPPRFPESGIRVVTAPGLEILLSPDGRLEPSGSPGRWALGQGACLCTAEGAVPVLEVDGALVKVQGGEAVIRRLAASPVAGFSALWCPQALAGEEDAFEVILLSGTAEVRSGNRAETLAPGDRLVSAIDGSWRKRREEMAVLAALRESFQPSVSSAGLADLRRVGRVIDSPKGWMLEGGRQPSACLLGSPAEPFQAASRIRLPEGKHPVLGISFRLAGESCLHLLDPTLLADGSWHLLRLMVSPSFVSVSLDGCLLSRTPRPGFRSNPEAGLEGLGPVVWGGRLEVSGLEAWALR